MEDLNQGRTCGEQDTRISQKDTSRSLASLRNRFDSSGGDVTTDRTHTANLSEISVYDSDIEQCCQIQTLRSQEIGYFVPLLHQTREAAINKSMGLRRPLLDHNAFGER